MSPELEAVHPVLMSRDVAASVRFYEALGFTPVFRDDAEAPKYAVIRRDKVELHLQWQDQAQWAHPIDRPTYRFLVFEVDALYEQFRANESPAKDERDAGRWNVPGDTPWGTREFHVRDPDGNGLQFYRPLGN